MVLTNFAFDPLLDLAPWVGQREASFRFELVNGVTNEHLGEIHPIRSGELSHDTTRTIKRQLSLQLGTTDSAAINPLSDRILLFMTFPGGVEYPLGRYMFSSYSSQIFTSGKLSNVVLNDEMYMVDQPITNAFNGSPNPKTTIPGSNAVLGTSVATAIKLLLTDFPITVEIEPSNTANIQSWNTGSNRGAIIEQLALSGGYFSPWFGHDTKMHFLAAFNPALAIPDFDWDDGNQVLRTGIVQTSDILNAPNRFIVISNNASDKTVPAVGRADVPNNAPNSFDNRGFYIVQVTDTQAVNGAQCNLIARNLMQRQTIYETVTIRTAPDPRHDSYNVIKWQDALWLELGWSLSLNAGSEMSHTLRKAYA